MKRLLTRFVHRIIDFLSFRSSTREIAEILNRKLETKSESSHKEENGKEVASHPGGFYRDLCRRRLSIAESYIQIVYGLESDQYLIRIKALENLVNQSFHAKTVRMPLNTARVQILLMKEAIKSRNNRRHQLELLSDFSLASYGQEQVIRHFCQELGIIEVPETGKSLKDLNMGYDFHVHDSMSEGRKTPSQILLDAFIKGISELTFSHYTIEYPHIVFETYHAAKILGIKVHIGIEFSVGKERERTHYMFVPKYMEEAQEFLDFFTQNEELAFFSEGLKQNAQKRKDTISKVLESFNKNHLPVINSGYLPGSSKFCNDLKWEDLQHIVMDGQASRIHLGQLLYFRLKPVYYKRVLSEKAHFEIAQSQYRQKKLTELELNIIKARYESVRKAYTAMNPQDLMKQYLDFTARIDYNSHFTSENQVFQVLSKAQGHLVYMHPLKFGLHNAIRKVILHHRYITHIQSFNMHDSFQSTPVDMRLLTNFIDVLNNGELENLISFLENLGIDQLSKPQIEEAFQHYHKIPLIPLCGSGSTGRSSVPGMGFIHLKSIPSKSRRHYLKKHYMLPEPISALILNEGKRPSKKRPGGGIVSMGKTKKNIHNYVGDEQEVERISLVPLWQHLHPFIKGIIRIAVSFPVAYYTIGWKYALLWYFITFSRNALVDMVSAQGFSPKGWSFADINVENATQSLFWTGFSVPLLNLVKLQIEIAIAMTTLGEGIVKETIRFFAICLANGSYIATHNKLRNFDAAVIKANFFRSILAWPLATFFSFAGNYMMVPAIVQAKFWSDFVAAMIEGIGKYMRRLKLRKRDLLEILPKLSSENRAERITAMLDILYVATRRSAGDKCLRQIIQREIPFKTRLLAACGNKRCRKEKEEMQNLYKKYTDELSKSFLADGSFIYLVDFIIENFEEKKAYILTEMLATEYPKFREWLARKQKKSI